MATVTHGSIGEFHSDSEEWTVYVERVEQYFLANEITTEGKKRARLLWSKYVCLNQESCGTTEGHSRGLQDIIKQLRDYTNPKWSVIIQRFKFNSGHQQVGESIYTYVVELQKIAEHCDFKDTLNKMLGDRLVCRIADTRVQHRLLAEHKCTFRKTPDISQAMELASKDAQDLQSIKDPISAVSHI